MSEQSDRAKPQKWTGKPLPVGLGAIVLIAVIAICWEYPSQVLYGYLAAWEFWLGIPIGAMIWLLIHRLSGGIWGPVLLDEARSAVRLLPIMALLIIPILIGYQHLYPWAVGIGVDPKEFGQFRAAYLSAHT